MKVTYNWLKDFVEIRIPPGKLAEKLTMAGLEVVGLEERGGDFIFEIEITSNRPDWLSVVGIAREVAAITGKKFKTTPATKPGGFAMHYGERQRDNDKNKYRRQKRLPAIHSQGNKRRKDLSVSCLDKGKA